MHLTFNPTAVIDSIPGDLLLALGAFTVIWCLAMVITFVITTHE
jgi:hypothetical protein